MNNLPSTSEPQEKRQQRGRLAIVQSIGSRSLIQAVNMITGIVTARTLAPAGRGDLAVLILWTPFLAGVLTLGIPSATIYGLRNRQEESSSIIATGAYLSAVLGIIAAVVGFFEIPIFLSQYSPSVIIAARWFMLSTPLASIYGATRAGLEARGDFTGSNLAQITTTAFTAIALFVCLLLHRLNPISAGLCYALAIVPTLLLVLQRLKLSWSNLRWSASASNFLLGYGVRSWPIDVLGTLSFQIDQILVVRFLSPAAMGSYVVMLSLSRVLLLIHTAVVQVLFPKAAGQSREEVLRLTGICARISTLVTIPSAILLCALGPILVRTFYGGEYLDAVGVFRLLLIEVTLSGCLTILSQSFMALGRPGLVSIYQFVGLSTSIPTMLVLIPRMGSYGAALALLTSTAIRLVLILVSFKFFLETKPPKVVPGSEDLRVLRGIFPRNLLEGRSYLSGLILVTLS